MARCTFEQFKRLVGEFWLPRWSDLRKWRNEEGYLYEVIFKPSGAHLRDEEEVRQAVIRVAQRERNPRFDHRPSPQELREALSAGVKPISAGLATGAQAPPASREQWRSSMGLIRDILAGDAAQRIVAVEALANRAPNHAGVQAEADAIIASVRGRMETGQDKRGNLGVGLAGKLTGAVEREPDEDLIAPHLSPPDAKLDDDLPF
jgi:hypothetical protein